MKKGKTPRKGFAPTMEQINADRITQLANKHWQTSGAIPPYEPQVVDKIYLEELKNSKWSYGIFLWEITTFGVIPYAGVDNKEISQLLKSGYRLEKPEMCSDELYDIMRQCWRENPAERPSFTQIRERLETIMQEDMPYIELMKHETDVTSCVEDHEDLGPQTTSL